MSEVTYHVMKNHTLGYVDSRQPHYFNPLKCTVDGYHWQNGAVCTDGTDIVPATLADFERFNVMPPPDFTD